MPVVAKFESSTNAREKLRALTTQITALKLEAKQICVEALKELCEEIFTANPDIQQFAWVQYGGEYNDEGAYHGINAVLVNEEVEDNEYYDLSSGHSKSDTIQKQINELGSDVLLEALGEYHMVTVVRGEAISVDGWRGY